MDFAGKIGVNRYSEFPDPRAQLLTIRLQLALYRNIIIIRLLQTMVGNEISS
jgi:hypothetical protein